jgi:signal transduction histidine kinase
VSASLPLKTTTPTAPLQQGRLHDDIRGLYQQTPASLIANTVGVLLIYGMFWRATPAVNMVAWLVPFFGLMLLRWLLYRRYPQVAELGIDALLRWRTQWNTLTVVSGLFWGVGVWLLYEWGDTAQKTALIVTVYAYTLGAIQLLAHQGAVFHIFAAATLLPIAARVLYSGGVSDIELAAMIVFVFMIAAIMGRNYRKVYDNIVELKVRTEHLMEQLRTEKIAAEEARRQAEVANRAKTQFFAAASHDLRQPLHALGLFAEALRQKSRNDAEVSQLVNSINSSVDALEGLFSELLDITRIDTGGVDPNPQDFSVRDIFGRLRLTFEPTAFEKGLVLDFRGERHHAHADPLLVERILRNLVSNAIRYTEDGGILVSCRTSGGQLKLQVWDTGVGIAEKERSRIFEEFYQVQGGRPLEAHHRKGLGLGLAIVKRLADLMRAPLSVRSVPGRGSVFTLELPIGSPPRVTGPAAAPKGPIGLTLDHRLIVVVEDEPAVSEALEVLLKGWGASVVSFDSVTNARAWALAQDPLRVTPDLLIVDYRLPEGSTGIDAIVALRGHFGPVPTIMVTGSTMSGHEEDARRHDFHLLVKPVVPNKLRAMIAFNLGVR